MEPPNADTRQNFPAYSDHKLLTVHLPATAGLLIGALKRVVALIALTCRAAGTTASSSHYTIIADL